MSQLGDCERVGGYEVREPWAVVGRQERGPNHAGPAVVAADAVRRGVLRLGGHGLKGVVDRGEVDGVERSLCSAGRAWAVAR